MRNVLLAVVVFTGTTAAAQELEPRSYSPSPIGTTCTRVGSGAKRASRSARLFSLWTMIRAPE